MVKVADPAVRTEVPRVALPAEKVMEPVGTPTPDIGVTFAVKTVVPPNTGVAGFTESVVELDTSEDCGAGKICVPVVHPVTAISPLSMSPQSDTRKYLLRHLGTMSKRNPARPKATVDLDRFDLRPGIGAATVA